MTTKNRRRSTYEAHTKRAGRQEAKAQRPISTLLASSRETTAARRTGRGKAASTVDFQTTTQCSVATLGAMAQRIYGMDKRAARGSAYTGLLAGTTDLAHKIKQAEATKHIPTVAVDLDGTIAEMYDEFDATEICKPRAGAKKALEEFKERGWRVIINTVRGDDKLTAKYLDEHDIPWDYINENPDQPEGTSGKVIADIYIDDRGVDARKAWSKVKDETIQRIEKQGELLAWAAVPAMVATRYKEAARVQRTVRKVIKHLPATADPGYGHVWWNPETKQLWAVLSDGDSDNVHQKWANALKAISGVDSVKTESEYGPHGQEDWIRVKSAGGALSILNKPYEWAGSLTGGPSPLTNSIVSGLLGAGGGYLGGTLLEYLMPEEYVKRNRLRRTLALLGGGLGALTGLPGAFANAGMASTAGKPLGWSALVTPDAKVPMAPRESTVRDNFYKQNDWQAMREALPEPSELFMRAAAGFCKAAYAGSGLYGSQGTALRPVPVDAFNRAIWNDVHNGTPPYIAAATSGLVTGVQQMYGGAPILRPTHFISGLANAGLDLATARIAGGILGALGGLTSAGQKQIQNLGIWGGFMRGVAGSVLGLR